MLKIFLFSLVGFLLLRFAVKLLSKVLGILLIAIAFILFAYQKGIGPFERNYFSLKELEQKYCENDIDQISCECIVQILGEDLHSRFNNQEIAGLEQDRIKGAYALHRSLKSRRTDIEACLNGKNNMDRLKEFELELYSYNNPFMQKIGGLFDVLFSTADSVWDDLRSGKEEVDERY